MNSALRISWPLPKVASFAFLIVLSGCSTTVHRKKADDAVLKIVAEVEQQLFGTSSEFSITTAYTGIDPDTVTPDDVFADRNQQTRRTITIDDAIDLAVKQNRRYQTQKEKLYLTTLTLTGEQHEFSPQFFARGTGSRTYFPNGDKTEGVGSNIGVDQMISTGANVSVTMATDILRYLTGDPRKTAGSTLSFSVFQPLLRGAGREVAAERLIQAERNVIYAVRDFSHFQNEFAASIVLDYFRLLQRKDTIYNEYNNYQSRIAATRYLRARAVDREKALDVNQAGQAELSAKNRYINAIVSYKNLLDDFKITLGLPQTVDLRLLDEEIVGLQERGIILLGLNSNYGFDLAVNHRLPLLNAIDRYEDAQRDVRIAANQLKTQIGIFANASIDSDGPTDYTDFDFDNIRRTVGIQLDLPIDRLRERNIYRASLIAFESQLRTLGLTLDELRSTIDEGIRELERLSQNYEIQSNAVILAERQVTGAQLSIEAGNAIYRDLEEAQDDLIAAQNAQTAALVDYLESRLDLLLEVGILNTGTNQFWLTESSTVNLDGGISSSPTSSTISEDGEVITPDELFTQ